MPTTDLPKFQSDGYRHERCPRCGRAIGYAPFTARLVGDRAELTHDGYDCTKG